LLIKQLRDGQTGAIEQLVNSYFNRLYSIVMHEVGGDAHASQDIVQETFLSAIKSASKFKGDSRLFTWLVGIAHHKVADHYRALKRERRFMSPLTDIQTVGKIDGAPSMDNLVEGVEESLRVNKALQGLAPDYRQVLLYKYVEDLSVFEISQIMKRSPKSIEGLLSRARREFKISQDGHEG
jgi:RNA polymerase sigma-70 factor, ECF subfamily